MRHHGAVWMLAAVLLSGTSANIFTDIKNGVSNVTNSVENALGLKNAPSPAGAMHLQSSFREDVPEQCHMLYTSGDSISGRLTHTCPWNASFQILMYLWSNKIQTAL